MLKSYPKFERGKIWEFYEKLPSSEKKFLDQYITYRKARGISREQDLQDIKRYIVQLRFILQKDFRKITLDNVRELTAMINTSWLKNEVKNGLKIDFKNFLKYSFKDWSERFSDLEDIKQNSRMNEEKINSQTIFSKEDIEKLVKHSATIFWKAFLLIQYEAGLRTGETRLLKNSSIKFNVDGDISEVSIYATKTKKARTLFIKEATFYLKKLKEEQINQGIKSVYVFPSPNNPNEPISKNSVNEWFRILVKKTLGRQGWSYLLRHSRANELYSLARNNKIARDTAQEFMGHSKDMSYVYEHLDKNKIKEMLKNQVYKLEDLPPEKKAELEKAIDRLKEELTKEKKARQEDFVKERKKREELTSQFLKLSKNVRELIKNKE